MLPLCFSAFVCFGLVLVLVGANQAEIADELGLSLSQSGLLGSALAFGIGIGVVAAGPLFDRWSRRPLFVTSNLLAALALLGVQGPIGYERLLLHIVVIGLGIGAYDTFISAVVVERFRERAARPMTVVHAGATVGAMLGPLLFGAIASRFGWTASFQWTGGAHLAIATWAFFVDFPAPRSRNIEVESSARRILRSPAFLPFALIAFAYVGVEGSLTLFAVPYADGALQLGPDEGRNAITSLWLGLFVGRMATAALPGRSAPWLLVAAGATAALLVLASVISASPQIVAIFAAVGLALGCVFPLMIARVAQQFPELPGTAAGLAAGAGAAGGFLIPWLTGVVGDEVGIAAAVGGMAVWCALVAAGGLAALRLRPTREKGHP